MDDAAARRSGCDRYPRLDVSQWEEVRDEPIGITTKYWLRPPDTYDDAEEYLWKVVKQETSGLFRVLGHDWAERVATAVAQRLGVPASQIDLAIRNGARGVVSKTFAPHGSGLALSNARLLLPSVVEGYPADKKREVRGYTIEAAFAVLGPYYAHPDAPGGVKDGASAFAGYLMLDALVGNQDRHHDNWGVIDADDGRRYIAPAFDQATGLGYQAPHGLKERCLANADVESYARKGRSKHFEGRPPLVTLAADALVRVPPTAAEAWIDRLASVSDDEWEPMLAAVPDDLMSQVDRTFAVEMLRVNKRRMLDEWRTRAHGT